MFTIKIMAFHVPQELLQWFQTYPTLSLTLLLLLLPWLLNQQSSATKALNLPPSPPRLPIIGHLHLLGSLPHHSLKLLSKQHGPLMLLHLGQTPTLIVSSPEMAQEVLKTHDIAFSNRPLTTASTRFLYGCKDIVFAPYGEYWRQMRKHCVMDLLSAKRVRSFRFVREEEVGCMVGQIQKSCLRGEVVNLSDLIADTTNNIISRIALGRKFVGELGKKNEYVELTEKSMKLFGFPSVEDMFPSLGWIDVLTGLDGTMKKTSKALLRFYDEVIQEHVAARSKGGERAKDFVDLLLDYEEDSSFDVPFTRENLKAVLMNVFLAGSDTTSTTLQWAMAELLNHPDEMKRAQEEVRPIVGLGAKAKVDEDDIHQMQYLNCVIKETLRLHPPVVLILRSSSTTSRVTIKGYDIPANTRVMVNAWAIARDPKVWDKPNEFIPERFMNTEIDFRSQHPEFIPFGAGRRVCPGISFGITSVEFVLASLLYWFDWELPGDKVIDMTESFGLSVPMKYSLCPLPTSHKF